MSVFSVVKGPVEGLKVSSGVEDFVFTEEGKKIAGAAAIGAVLTEQVAGVSGLSSASAGSEISMEFFTCTVQGIVLTGRFYKVEFAEQEIIEFVVKNTPSGAQVHAARSQGQKIIWMLPYHVRGECAQKAMNRKWTMFVSSFAALLQLGIIYYVTKGKLSFYSFVAELVIFSVVFLICSIVASRFFHFSRETTHILKALGFSDPKNVDLNKVNKAAEKRMRKETNCLPALISSWSYRF